MSYEFEFDDIEYDTGYGVQNGTLVVEVSPIYEDFSFSAHNEAGYLQTYGGRQVTDIEVLDATLFLVGNNGQELGDVEINDISKYIDVEALIKKVSIREDS